MSGVSGDVSAGVVIAWGVVWLALAQLGRGKGIFRYGADFRRHGEQHAFLIADRNQFSQPLHVGIEPGRRRWHGPRFKEILRQAMAEAYGVHGIDPPSARSLPRSGQRRRGSSVRYMGSLLGRKMIPP